MAPTLIIFLMFSSMMLLMLTGQRVFAVIGFVGSLCGLLLWGHGGGGDMAFNAAVKLFNASAMFMWVMMAALVFGAVFDGLGAVHAIENLFTDLGISRWGILVLMQLSFVIMGIFLDDTAMLVIVAPLYVPLLVKLGFNPIWFGVLYTITCQIAYLTPPFGYNLFLMRAMSPSDFSLRDIYLSIIPFVILMFICLVLIMIFPQIALWLPELVRGE